MLDHPDIEGISFVEGFPEVPHCLCYRCPFDKTDPECRIDCARALEEVILKEGPDTVGGFIVEPITAGGGIIPPVKEYFPMIQKICKKYEVWIIMDEGVCGFGRTGKFWGHAHYDVAPDIITMVKGLASSYEALSTTVVEQEIYDIFLNDTTNPEVQNNFFRDISTYGGCTAPMAAGREYNRVFCSLPHGVRKRDRHHDLGSCKSHQKNFLALVFDPCHKLNLP